MIDKLSLINSIASKAGDMLGGEKSRNREEIEKSIRALMSSALSKMNIVTREELDTQMAVLLHTRQKLDALEKRVDELESQNKSADSE